MDNLCGTKIYWFLYEDLDQGKMISSTGIFKSCTLYKYNIKSQVRIVDWIDDCWSLKGRLRVKLQIEVYCQEVFCAHLELAVVDICHIMLSHPQLHEVALEVRKFLIWNLKVLW